MKKITLIFLFHIFIGYILNEAILLADDKDKKAYIKGFVIDELGNTLLNGTIQIFSNNENSCSKQLLECVTIQSNGSFKSNSSYPVNSVDGILIAAYPYDLDRVNIEPTSEDNIHIAAYPYDLDVIITNNPNTNDNIHIAAYPYDLDVTITNDPSTNDNIHIAAYPYDLDNSGFTNEPTDLNNIIQESDKNEIEIIVKIKRSNFEEIKSSSNTISKREEELNKNSSVKLNQNYPNPFNPSTLISFNLPDAINVKLQVYSLNGKLISTLINNKVLPAGDRHVQFNANELPSGIYIYKLVAGDQTLTQKMMLLK